MSNSNNLFNGLVGKAINEGINSTNEKNTSAQVRLVLALTGILFFVGAEAVKVFFRKDFGRKGINLIQLFISCLCFLGLGIVCTGHYLFPEKGDLNIGISVSETSYLVTGVFYITLSIYLLRKGIIEFAKAKTSQANIDFKGETDVLKILESKGWSQNKIRYLGEPGYTLLLALVLFLYNPIGSIPLAVCAISVWGHAVMEFLFLQNPFQPDLAQQLPESTQSPQLVPPVKPSHVNTDF